VENQKIHETTSDRVFTTINYIILTFVLVLVLYPCIYVASASISDAKEVMAGRVFLWPVGFSLEGYKAVFRHSLIMSGFYNAAFYTLTGTVINVFMTMIAAYPLSRKDFFGRNVIMLLFTVTMFISGGLIPTYVLMYSLKLINNYLVYILPHGFWAFNMLLMRTYFDTIPPALEESARLDGASDLRIFVSIIVPLSMPIIAVIAMYSGVWQWNSWFDAMLYMTKTNMHPLQEVLRQLINSAFANTIALAQGDQVSQSIAASSPEAVRMATLVVTILPIVIVYPFFQKYFVRGVMIGAVKA